jgi:hypothetical protein
VSSKRPILIFRASFSGGEIGFAIRFSPIILPNPKLLIPKMNNNTSEIFFFDFLMAFIIVITFIFSDYKINFIQMYRLGEPKAMANEGNRGMIE